MIHQLTRSRIWLSHSPTPTVTAWLQFCTGLVSELYSLNKYNWSLFSVSPTCRPAKYKTIQNCSQRLQNTELQSGTTIYRIKSDTTKYRNIVRDYKMLQTIFRDYMKYITIARYYKKQNYSQRLHNAKLYPETRKYIARTIKCTIMVRNQKIQNIVRDYSKELQSETRKYRTTVKDC